MVQLWSVTENPPHRPGKRERTRALILETATELFDRADWDSITMEGIADEAALVKATIFNHFGSKAELLVEVINGLFSDFWASLDQQQADAEAARPLRAKIVSGRERRRRRVDRLYTFVRDDHPHLTPLIFAGMVALQAGEERKEGEPSTVALDWVFTVVTETIDETNYKPKKADAPSSVLASVLVTHIAFALQRGSAEPPLVVLDMLESYMASHGKVF